MKGLSFGDWIWYGFLAWLVLGGLFRTLRGEKDDEEVKKDIRKTATKSKEKKRLQAEGWVLDKNGDPMYRIIRSKRK